MNVGVCAAKFVGYELLKFIFSKQRVISFVVTSSNDDYESKIISLCKKNNVKCCRGLDINSDEFIDLNKQYSIDLVLMLWFPTIVKKSSLDSVNKGFINLHPSYLPWNRGMHPYYWTIVDNTIAGITIHFINENIDEGQVLFQKSIDIDITDTGGTLYEKNLIETIELFKENYDNILNSNYDLKEIDNSSGSFHLSVDINKHSEIKLDKTYKAIDLINLIRARTFENIGSSYFYLDDKKYNVKLYVEDDKSDNKI